MNGLNAYPRSIPRFQSGGSTGFSIGTAPDTSGVLDTAFSPISGTPVANTPVGTFGVSPATIAGIAVPGLAAPLGVIGLGKMAIDAFNQKQDPAPVVDATVDAYSPPPPGIAIGAPAGVSVQGISPGATAPGQAQGVLDAMIANFAQEQAQQQAEAQEAQTAATVAATADAVDADAGATAAANAAAATSGNQGGSNQGASNEGVGGGFSVSSQDVDASMSAGDPGGGGPSGDGPSSSTSGGGTDTGASDGNWRMGGQVMSYQQGGKIMNYAQGGEAYGRGGDSMLVHMNPREVAGLQALARSNGTSMTINPNTGYPEAFNLKALLPALIGLGLNAFAPGVGSAVGQALGTSSAVGTGVAVGGATALGTGSLKKGIMAGLGAYGGAGLGEGLAGSSGLAGTTPTPTPGLEGVTGSGVIPKPLPTDPSLVGSPTSLASTAPGGASGLTAPPNFANLGTGVPPNPTFPNADLYSSSAPTMGTGATVSPSTPMAGVTKPGLTAGQAFKYGSAALTPAMQPEPLEAPKSTAMIRPYDFEYNPDTGAYDRPAGDTSEATYFSPTYTARDPYLAAAGGGLMDSMRTVNFDKEDDYYAAGGLTAFKQGGRPKSRSLMGEDYYRFMGRDDTMLGTAEKNFAGGGTPRFLSGGGDGMSDDIPAVIGDKQPARLADGEFVIPADVVSHLGNGSSKAGAKRLYEMMADIRRERTGTKKQAPAIKPSKFMPA
jgi:hypothetical protein